MPFIIDFQNILNINMETQIIKINSLKNSLQSLFSNLASKFKSKQNFDITVIVQPNNQQQNNILDQSNHNKHETQLKDTKKHLVNFKQNDVIFNQEMAESYVTLSEQSACEHVFQIEKQINQVKDKNIVNMVKSKHYKLDGGKENKNLRKKPQQTISSFAQTDVDNNCDILKTQIRLNQSLHNNLDAYSVKLNNLNLDQSEVTQSQTSEGENDSNAGFLIQKHLNQALVLMEQNKSIQLENFLYDYKQKYNFINIRTQTKWSLLMAHCKELKLQFQRAATNYITVIQNLKENPRMIAVEMGDIYNRLGLCYFQIREWNKGITALTEALNCYKESRRVLEYANCITNLGVLYFEAKYFIEAEKCLLMAFNIKRFEGQKSNRANLLPLLFNLFDCNLNLKNFLQSKNLLDYINEIIEQSQRVDRDYRIIFNIKKAKLDFYEGNLQSTQTYCQKALSILKENNISWKLQFAEPYELMGLLKQERGQFNRSREYFATALKILQKYQPVDSPKIQNLKKRLDIVSKLTINEAETKKSLKNNRKNMEEAEKFSENLSQSSSSEVQESLKS